jgi:hypothetical protein
VNVTVVTPSGKFSEGQFNYVPAPVVKSAGHASGPTTGGTSVTIAGSNLANAIAVYFGSNLASITSDSAIRIVVTSPAASAGTIYVTVVTAGGASVSYTNSSATSFTYVATSAQPIVVLSPKSASSEACGSVFAAPLDSPRASGGTAPQATDAALESLTDQWGGPFCSSRRRARLRRS